MYLKYHSTRYTQSLLNLYSSIRTNDPWNDTSNCCELPFLHSRQVFSPRSSFESQLYKPKILDCAPRETGSRAVSVRRVFPTYFSTLYFFSCVCVFYLFLSLCYDYTCRIWWHLIECFCFLLVLQVFKKDLCFEICCGRGSPGISHTSVRCIAKTTSLSLNSFMSLAAIWWSILIGGGGCAGNEYTKPIPYLHSNYCTGGYINTWYYTFNELF